MGVIVRNGNAYGGFDKDFTVVDSLESVDNIQKEHLYAVGKKLYYHNGTEWIEFNPDVEIPEAKTINADSQMIVTGDGQGWVLGSPFYVKRFTLPSSYSNKNIAVLEGVGDMVAISAKSDTDDLNAPILAVSEGAKVFFEEGVDIDISGITKMYIHESPKIFIEGGSFVKIDGRPQMIIEGVSLLKLDDYASVNMTNGACINMNGLETGIGGKNEAIGGPSPYFGMQGNSTFLMNCSDADYAPLIVAGPLSFEFLGKGGQGSISAESADARLKPVDYTSFITDSFSNLWNTREENPFFRIGKGTHIIADSEGVSNLKFGVQEQGLMEIDISSDKHSHTFVKFGAVEDGEIQVYMTGSIFKQMSGASHYEMHNASQFIMRGLMDDFDKPWNDQTLTPRILDPNKIPAHAAGKFGNGYEIPRPSPLMALYDAPVFIMRGTWPKPTENDTVPSGWSDRAVQFSDSPLFEMIERSSFIMEADSKILIKDSAQIKASQTGSLEINADGIIINGIEISNEKLTQLLALIGE